MVVGGSHRRLTGCRRGSGGPERPIPAGAGPGELAREVDGEGAEAAVRVCVQVVGVARSPPGGLLFDEGVRPQGVVGSGQRGVRRRSGVEVQHGSPLGCADRQGRAAGAGAPRESGQQRVQVTYV